MIQNLLRTGLSTVLLLATSGSIAMVGQAAERSPVDLPEQTPAQITQHNRQPLVIAETPDTITRLYAHNQAGRRAVTLFVRELPLITFLDEQIELAEPLAAKINQLNQSEAAAETITVLWDPQKNAYVIHAADQPLVQMNANILLAGTTHDIAEDALQITNRLRWLLGNATPLTQIAGRPPQTVTTKPQPAPQPKPVAKATEQVVSTQRGQASWYGGYFHGRRTASGAIYNQYALTAAHKKLKFGTRVRVTNLNNGKSVIVTITDRGPFIRGRIIDLSRKAAQEVGMIKSGVAPVKVEVLKKR